MRYKVKTDRWGVPRLHEGDFGYGSVAEAVKAYSRERRDNMRESLEYIRIELESVAFSAVKRRRYKNVNLYMNRLANSFRKIRMANKILEEHNGANRS